MTQKLQSTYDTSGIEWPALTDQNPCMAHIIGNCLGAFMNSFSEKCHTKSAVAEEHD
jgi:hypothetical protein